jgi:hypothetical protein
MSHFASRAFVVVAFGVVALGASADERRRPPLAGTPVQLGPYLGEIFVWETGVDLNVYDRSGSGIPPRAISGEIAVVRFNGKPRELRAQLTPEKTVSRANMDLFGVKTIEVTVSVFVRGEKHVGRALWRLVDDQARQGTPSRKLQAPRELRPR